MIWPRTASSRPSSNDSISTLPWVEETRDWRSETRGKVEIESLEEGREEAILGQIINAAVLLVFRRRVHLAEPQTVVGAFTEDTVVHAGDDLPSSAYAETLELVPALAAPVLSLTGGSEDPAMVASATEFILEGLHLTKRLNKEAAGSRATYRGRG